MFNLFKTKKLTKHTRKSNIETKREKIILNSFVIYLSKLYSKTYKLISFKSVDSIQMKKNRKTSDCDTIPGKIEKRL